MVPRISPPVVLGPSLAKRGEVGDAARMPCAASEVTIATGGRTQLMMVVLVITEDN
jgi:hypothetical protein